MTINQSSHVEASCDAGTFQGLGGSILRVRVSIILEPVVTIIPYLLSQVHETRHLIL